MFISTFREKQIMFSTAIQADVITPVRIDTISFNPKMPHYSLFLHFHRIFFSSSLLSSHNISLKLPHIPAESHELIDLLESFPWFIRSVHLWVILISIPHYKVSPYLTFKNSNINTQFVSPTFGRYGKIKPASPLNSVIQRPRIDSLYPIGAEGLSRSLH